MTKIAIIGGGPAGLMAAITAKRKNAELDITVFDKKDIASTLLPTGGGRCNISYNEPDIRLFAENYPRGEKFLYSLFNQFFINDTIEFFKSIGIETYIQGDNRIFPKSNKSLDVIFALKNEIKRLNIKVRTENILSIRKSGEKFLVNDKIFDKVILAIGGRKSDLLSDIEELGHKIIVQRPALSALEIEEKYLSQVSGVSLKNQNATVKYNGKQKEFFGDLLFTHKGISGPLAYKISSIYSCENYSNDKIIEFFLHFVANDDFNLQKELDKNSKKEILSLISDFIPKSLAKILLEQAEIKTDKFCYQINKDERTKIEEILLNFKLNIISPLKGGEIVSSGGIDLKQINSKTMESKIVKNLFFCGEVVDIDGFCGGFNLQNCWTTGYVAGSNL